MAVGLHQKIFPNQSKIMPSSVIQITALDCDTYLTEIPYYKCPNYFEKLKKIVRLPTFPFRVCMKKER